MPPTTRTGLQSSAVNRIHEPKGPYERDAHRLLVAGSRARAMRLVEWGDLEILVANCDGSLHAMEDRFLFVRENHQVNVAHFRPTATDGASHFDLLAERLKFCHDLGGCFLGCG